MLQNVTNAYVQRGQALNRLEDRSNVHVLELLDIGLIDSMKLPSTCGRHVEDNL